MANIYSQMQANEGNTLYVPVPFKRIYKGANPDFSQSEKVDILQLTATCNGSFTEFLYEKGKWKLNSWYATLTILCHVEQTFLAN